MPRTEKYFIGPQLLGDIRRVVGRVEAEPYGSGVTRIETRLQDMPRPSAAGLRRALFSGAWNKMASKGITFNGTSETATAVNILATVDAGCGESRQAIVSRIDGQWHLIAAECA